MYKRKQLLFLLHKRMLGLKEFHLLYICLIKGIFHVFVLGQKGSLLSSSFHDARNNCLKIKTYFFMKYVLLKTGQGQYIFCF